MAKLTHIYVITNKVNGKRYVGVSNNIVCRKSSHFRAKSNYCLSRAIRKYGRKSFDFDIIYSSWDDTHCRVVIEPYFIRLFNTTTKNGRGYNETIGGEGILGFKHSNKEKVLISRRSRTLWKLETYRNKITKCWDDNDFRNSRSIQLKSLWNKPEMTKVKSGLSIRMWNNEQFREKHKKATRKAWSRIDLKKKKSDISKNLWQDGSFRKKIIDARSKEYEIQFPDGSISQIKNLSLFCSSHKLSKSAMCQVSKGKIKQHKGYKCKSL